MKSIKIKTLLVILATVFVGSTMVVAQPPQGRPQGAQQGQRQGPPAIPNSQQITEMVSELKTNLSLSDEQEVKIEKLYVDHFDIVSAKMKQGRPERSEMEKLNTDLETNVKAELTKKQVKLYKKLQKENPEQQRQ